MTSLFKKLSFALVAGVVAAVGFVAPANAAPLTGTSVTTTGAIGTSGTNTSPITITATTVSAAVNYNDMFYVDLPAGWSFTSTFMGPTCNANTVTQTGLSLVMCVASNTGSPRLKLANGISGPVGIPAGTTISVTFATGFLNVAAARDFTFGTSGFNATTASDDSATVSLAAAGSSTVTFDANGGTGTTAAQTASSATALTANGFTRTGYTFAGWNTAANGSGTAYADGSSYGFSSNITLYAQWTATLANTGINATTGISLLVGGASLALVGAEFIMIARRKRSN